jgi:hypothetical protein
VEFNVLIGDGTVRVKGRALPVLLLLAWVAGLAGCAGLSGSASGPSGASTLPGAAAGPSALSIPTTGDSGAEQIPLKLFRPEGPGLFPAVVILHDCSGVGPGRAAPPAAGPPNW